MSLFYIKRCCLWRCLFYSRLCCLCKCLPYSMQPLLPLDVYVLLCSHLRRVCSTSVCAVPGRVCVSVHQHAAAINWIRSICSTPACAVPGGVWPTADCASPGRAVSVQHQPVLCQEVSGLQQNVPHLDAQYPFNTSLCCARRCLAYSRMCLTWTRSICSSPACAVPGGVWPTAECASPGRAVSVQHQPVLCQEVCVQVHSSLAAPRRVCLHEHCPPGHACLQEHVLHLCVCIQELCVAHGHFCLKEPMLNVELLFGSKLAVWMALF
jgi:hypothetical protein